MSLLIDVAAYYPPSPCKKGVCQRSMGCANAKVAHAVRSAGVLVAALRDGGLQKRVRADHRPAQRQATRQALARPAEDAGTSTSRPSAGGGGGGGGVGGGGGGVGGGGGGGGGSGSVVGEG